LLKIDVPVVIGAFKISDNSNIGIQHENTATAASTASLKTTAKPIWTATATSSSTTDPLEHIWGLVVAIVDFGLIPVWPCCEDFKISVFGVSVASTHKLPVVFVIFTSFIEGAM
jgi:hypothetical protein